MSAEAAGVVTRTALPSRAAVRRRGAGDLARPPEGASQLRDSAGLQPDFAGSTPVGNMCPTRGGYVRRRTRAAPMARAEERGARRRWKGATRVAAMRIAVAVFEGAVGARLRRAVGSAGRLAL